jgi:hypothetical protein
MIRKSLFIAIILAMLLPAMVTGCAQPVTQKSTPAPPQPAPVSPQPTPASPPPTPVPPPETPPTNLPLTVTQPVDGSIVNSDTVEVKGRTSPGAVVSVNDEIVNADAQGAFTLTIPLEEGLNTLEVIASDDTGNEASVSLTVAYVKGG